MSDSRSPRRLRRWPAAAVLAVTLVLVTGAAAHASNDPAFPEQWALAKIGAPAAWGVSTGTGVRIGIVDTGVDLAHEDLGKVVAHTSCIGARGDAARCSGSGQDDQGHGTHVAGIAAATKDNGKGIAGVAPGAELVVAKALDAGGGGSTEDVNAGIKWVVDRGARVVNLSLGDNFLITSLLGTSLEEGIAYAWSKGAVTVLAAGNTNLLGLGSSQYGDIPAIVVGATGPDDRPASYSSPLGDAQWAIMAPGGAGNGRVEDDIYSTYWREGQQNQYRALAGTSMAAPHVAGAAALLLARGLSPQEAVARILDTADSRVSCGGGSPTCRGRLDVSAAVTGTPVSTPPPPPTPSRGLLGLPIGLGGLPLLGGLLSGAR